MQSQKAAIDKFRLEFSSQQNQMKQTLVLDSSQLTEYFTCPQLWTYEHIDKITIATTVKDDLVMGAYGHKLLELYYKNLPEVPANIAAGRALDFDPLASNEFRETGLSTERIKAIQERFNLYWMTYCVRDVDVCIGQNGPLVEQGFSYELLNTDEYLFVLEGRIDLIAKMQGQMLFVDHKWQNRQHTLYKKSIQFKNYALATGCNLGIINYVRLHQQVTKDTLSRDLVSFSTLELKLWKEELIEMFRLVASELSNGGNTRKNWSACPGRFGYACQYTKLCEESTPEVKAALISAFYKPKKEWKPW
jgi:hypothetical protein